MATPKASGPTPIETDGGTSHLRPIPMELLPLLWPQVPDEQSLREWEGPSSTDAVVQDYPATPRDPEAIRLAVEVAHDAKNLLAVASGNLEMMCERRRSPKERRALINEVRQAVDLLTEMMQDLLAGVRPARRGGAPLDIGIVVSSARHLIDRICGASVAVDVEARPGLMVRADPVRLQSALLNIARNAREAMPNGGSLKIAVHEIYIGRGKQPQARRLPAGRYAMVCIADTGVGMPEACIERVFEPFVTAKDSGFGIGLASARAFVEETGGGAWLRSAPGAGTTVELYLPLIDQRCQPAVADDRNSTGAAARTIFSKTQGELGPAVAESPVLHTHSSVACLSDAKR